MDFGLSFVWVEEHVSSLLFVVGSLRVLLVVSHVEIMLVTLYSDQRHVVNLNHLKIFKYLLTSSIICATASKWGSSVV